MKRDELIRRLNAMADEMAVLASALMEKGNQSVDHDGNLVDALDEWADALCEHMMEVDE